MTFSLLRMLLRLPPLQLLLLQLHCQAAGTASSSGAHAFCAPPQMLDTWSKLDGCNGVPQFLSTFCSDHVSIANGSLALTLDDHPCAQPSHPTCGPPTHMFGGASLTGPAVFLGNISATMRPGAGASVSTTLVAYKGSNFGIAFNGGDLTKVGVSIGSGHYSATLPFDAGRDFHRFDMIWGNATASFFADGQRLTLVPPLKPSDVPTAPMPLMLDIYACGASYCKPAFDPKSLPATTAIRLLSYTPHGAAEAKCANPPAPPAFCDSGAALGVAWIAKNQCHEPSFPPLPDNGTTAWSGLAFMPDHVLLSPAGELELLADRNITEGPGGKWYCTKAKGIYQAAGAVSGASRIHYGTLSVVLRSAAEGTITSIQLGMSNTTGMALTFGVAAPAQQQQQHQPQHASFCVGSSSNSLQLGFDPSAAKHNYTFVWRPSSVELLVDGKLLHTETKNVPQEALPVTVAAVPTPANVTSSATLARVSFVPQGTLPVECDPGPLSYKLLWEDHFNSSVLGEQWTISDNCTHGFPGQLYVKEGVVLEDGKLKLRAFEFKGGNKTGPDGVSQRFGSGWVDCQSNRSNHWITDCNMMNEKAIPYNFNQGKWEVSAKMPTAPNGTAGHFWTALWLLPDEDICWPKGGEVDILESDIWGQQPPYMPHAAYHWSHQGSACFKDAAKDGFGAGFPQQKPKVDYSQGFHTYTVEVQPRMLIFSVDGQAYYTATEAEAEGVLPYTDMYLIMGNQLWRNWDFPAELPADFEIDYVKAWVPA